MHGLDLEVGRGESMEGNLCLHKKPDASIQGVLYRGHLPYHKQIIHA